MVRLAYCQEKLSRRERELKPTSVLELRSLADQGS
jgi:hypothetical protein